MTDKQKEAMEAAAQKHCRTEMDHPDCSMGCHDVAYRDGYKTALSPDHLKFLSADQLMAIPLVRDLVEAAEILKLHQAEDRKLCWNEWRDDYLRISKALTSFKKEGEL